MYRHNNYYTLFISGSEELEHIFMKQTFWPLNIFLVFTRGTQQVSVVLHAFEDFAVEEELEWFTMTLDTLVIPVGRVSLTQRNATIFIEDKDSEYNSNSDIMFISSF